MWPIVGEVVVRVALVEEPRKPVPQSANILRNLLGANP
jgi:hypothetical protein